MNLIDIGVNLTDRRFDHDRGDVIRRAMEAGVGQMVLTGTDEKESVEAADLAVSHAGMLFSTAGVHPHKAQFMTDSTLQTVRDLWNRPEVVAIGETGLDFNRDYSPRPDQERGFAAQVSLAVEVNAPLFLHERDAHEPFLAILNDIRPADHPAVLHCFTGTAEELTACLDAGLHIGITGWICDERRGAHLQELVSRIPSDRLMIETDAPWLLPRDLRPKPKKGRNEPAFLPHVLERVALCRAEPALTTAKNSVATTRRFFRLPDPVVKPAA